MSSPNKDRVYTTGASITGGDPALAPARLEINDFIDLQTNFRGFSLYVQAVNDIKDKTPESDLESWYRLGGIHAEPYTDNWNEVPKRNSDEWCAHGQVTFATWHRPYLATVERAVQAKAIEYAKGYTTDSEAWMKAAEDLRLPYWNYTINDFTPPRIIFDNKNMAEIDVFVAPDGRVEQQKNPFLAYTYRQEYGPPIADPVKPKGSTTVRGVDFDDPKTLTRWRTHLAYFKEQLETGKLMSIEDYWLFATVQKHPDPTVVNTGSLEQLHNGIHTGLGGDMNESVSAHDPIFWIHHAYIDKLLDDWFQIHRNGPSAGPPEPDAPLLPFRWREESFWPAGGATLEDTTNLGYRYEPVAAPRGPGAPAPREYLNEWCVEVQCKKYELGGSFAIYIFAGEVPAYGEWTTSPNYLAAYHVFGNTRAESCANCRRSTDTLQTGALDITSKLVDMQRDIDDIEGTLEYLKGNLKFAIESFVTNAPAELPSLKLRIVHTPLTPRGVPRGGPSEPQGPYNEYPETGESTPYEF